MSNVFANFAKIFVTLSTITLIVILIGYVSRKKLDEVNSHLTDGCNYANCTWKIVYDVPNNVRYCNVTVLVNVTNITCIYGQVECPTIETKCYMLTGAVCPIFGNCVNHTVEDQRQSIMNNIYIVSWFGGTFCVALIMYIIVDLFCICKERISYHQIN